MPFSGSQKTGLQVYGIPGPTHSFLAKTAETIVTVVRFTSEEIALAALAGETMTQAYFADEDIALAALTGEKLEN